MPAPPQPGEPAPLEVALLTPPGRGALAVVGVAGGRACDLADRLFQPRRGPPLASRPDRSIAVGVWRAFAGSAGEELVVVRQAADRLEIHCHGGAAAAEAILASLESEGAVRRSWPDWLATAGTDAIVTEARQALAVAAGPRAARILGRQLAGTLTAELTRLGRLPAAERGPAVARLLRAARIGLRLAAPWRVVVAGPVNAGKSSLVNALAGHARSIVSPQAGTTRDLVTTRLVLEGWEVELIDTAGGRTDLAGASPTERAGITRAAEAAAEADLVLRVVAAGSPLPEPGPREIVVITKADLVPDQPSPAAAVVTSALTGQGIAALEQQIIAALVPEDQDDPGLLDGPVPFTPRQFECIRLLKPAASEPGGAARVLERAVEASEAMDGEAQRTRSERRPGGPQ
jgi:tRNA modification GTPase